MSLNQELLGYYLPFTYVNRLVPIGKKEITALFRSIVTLPYLSNVEFSAHEPFKVF